MIIRNATPELYRRWLRAAADGDARTPGGSASSSSTPGTSGPRAPPRAGHPPDRPRLSRGRRSSALGLEGERRADDGPAAGSTAAQRAPAPRPIDVRVDVRRPLYVWGSGQAGRQVAANLTGAGVAFQGFLDSDRRRWGQEVAGHPVHAPAVALDGLTANPTPPFILIGSIAQDAIGGDIERAGGRLRDHYLPDAATVEIHRAPFARRPACCASRRVPGSDLPLVLVPSRFTPHPPAGRRHLQALPRHRADAPRGPRVLRPH